MGAQGGARGAKSGREDGAGAGGGRVKREGGERDGVCFERNERFGRESPSCGHPGGDGGEHGPSLAREKVSGEDEGAARGATAQQKEEKEGEGEEKLEEGGRNETGTKGATPRVSRCSEEESRELGAKKRGEGRRRGARRGRWRDGGVAARGARDPPVGWAGKAVVGSEARARVSAAKPGNESASRRATASGEGARLASKTVGVGGRGVGLGRKPEWGSGSEIGVGVGVGAGRGATPRGAAREWRRRLARA